MNKLDPDKYVVVTTDKYNHVLFLSGNNGHTAPAFSPLSNDVIQFRTHEDAAYASKSMWENYHNGGTIWKVDHLYLDPYYKDPMHNGVCKKNKNFSERLMKCFSFDSYMTLYPEFVTKLLAKGPKVAEITTKETDIDLGNGFGWNLEKGTLIIHVNGSNYYFGPMYKKSDSEVKRVKNLDGSTDVLNVPKSGAKPYEYFGFLSAYDGNPYRKLTEFFRSLNLGFWGGSSADEDLYRDYQEANGDKSKFINLWDPKYRKSAELRWEELSKLGWIQTYDH